ncbi:hypothetical protein CEP88_04005 [Roseobacter denitrificans]|uniref:Uncharacterized protein n=1 Tax=Roseobacter denitrificans (strain ATCC 33942 / OCh 114) TaxID=375451 RepID=Q165H7_ROSDO|nr:hypothetical protein [Roseobacter denitrificans]ABG32366.1 hypothetical protein RD1_2840 [Roseobacter denitrificans OCh 114]AVL51839.1 hypothetical protein CEP88_04005 [Roseobacter denitrificans]SFF80897.1 hypothetical protein SAMN05443635_102333 [Roseobacter denitrificans OCh 114]
MARDPLPLFLERGVYRRRRMMDALRLLTVLGVVLWLIPALWPNDPSAGAQTLAMSRALFYIFGVWAALIAISAVLAFRLRRPEGSDTGAEDVH